MEDLIFKAEQGDADAQFALGLHFEEGQDYAQAVYWYRRAAEQGDVFAQSFLGESYEEGDGVSQDIEQAVYWYCRAAKQGDTDAKKALRRLKGK